MDEFVARCTAVFSIVQRDLDATGLGSLRMHPHNATFGGIPPAVWAALPDGGFDASSGDAMMTPDMDDEALLLTASEAISDTLMHVLRIFWPVCKVHDGPPMVLVADSDADVPGVWFCGRGDHRVAMVGHLSPSHVLSP